MSDSLFIMQRYQGSDSEVDDDNDKDSKLKQVLERAKQKKRKILEQTIQHKEQFIGPPKKKKKKQKVTDQSTKNAFVNEKNEIESIEEIAIASEIKQKGKKHKKKKTSKIDDAETELPKEEEIADVSIEEADDIDVCFQDEELNEDQFFPIIKDVLDKKEEKIHRSLPEWLEKPAIINIDVHSKEKIISKIDFLDDFMKDNLLKNGIRYLFPVQTEVIPWLLQSSEKRLFVRPSDLCVSAPTGSGKTLAFVIPIVQSLKARVVNKIRALIVLPVRDLALQVYKVFERFCKGTELKIALIVGNSSFEHEQKMLGKNSFRGYQCLVDIVVATPGRLIDHIDRNPGFNLEHLRFLVIDEADRMMEEIQQGWLKKIEGAIYNDKSSTGCSCFSIDDQYKKTGVEHVSTCSFPHVSEPLQKLYYSATLSQDPERLHELSLYQPKLFTSIVESNELEDKSTNLEDDFIGKYTTPKELTEHFVICDRTIKPLVIWHLIKMKNFKKILCFTHTLESSHRLHIVLNKMFDDGIKVRELSSNLSTIQRKIILEQFANGKIHVLVCSDMMARGIDIEGIDCVLSYDVPHYIKTYVHRIGRTARAGKVGVAITLMEKVELQKFNKMLVAAGKVLPTELDYDHSNLLPMEETFKNALSLAGKTVFNETRKKTCFKKGVSKKAYSLKSRKGKFNRKISK